MGIFGVFHQMSSPEIPSFNWDLVLFLAKSRKFWEFLSLWKIQNLGFLTSGKTQKCGNFQHLRNAKFGEFLSSWETQNFGILASWIFWGHLGPFGAVPTGGPRGPTAPVEAPGGGKAAPAGAGRPRGEPGIHKNPEFHPNLGISWENFAQILGF